MKLFVRHSGKWFWHTQRRKELDNNLLFTNFNNLLFHFSFSMSLFPSPSPSLSRSLYSWSVQWLGMLMNHEKNGAWTKKNWIRQTSRNCFEGNERKIMLKCYWFLRDSHLKLSSYGSPPEREQTQRTKNSFHLKYEALLFGLHFFYLYLKAIYSFFFHRNVLAESSQKSQILLNQYHWFFIVCG